MICIIAAIAKNGVIGKDGVLPWNIPQELYLFRRLTRTHPVIMGRRTFESLQGPLPDRMNIVVSNSTPPQDNVTVCSSVDEAIAEGLRYDTKVFIIGGASVYSDALVRADVMYISYLKSAFSGDAYFPHFRTSEFTIEEEKEYDDFTLVKYVRRKKND